jgi:hypothetical protein
MRNLLHVLLAGTLALVGAISGCGDDSAVTFDARPAIDAGSAVDAGSDAAVAATFADFVKDLILDKTNETGVPATVDFGSTDSEAPGQFDSLF